MYKKENDYVKKHKDLNLNITPNQPPAMADT